MKFKRTGRYEGADEELVFICDCGSADHLFHVSKVDDFIGLSIVLNYRRGFFQRVLAAVRYVFKCDSRGWTFEDVLLSQDDQKELAEYLACHG